MAHPNCGVNFPGMEQVFAPRAPSPQGHLVTWFKMVVVYDDVRSGITGKNIADFIARAMGPICEFETALWNLALLGDAPIRKAAGDWAGDAEILILSLRDGDALTCHPRDWVAHWVSHSRGVSPALVAVFEQGGAATSSAVRYLEHVAGRAHVEFLQRTLNQESDTQPELAELLQTF
jgi:hypothetical protein